VHIIMRVNTWQVLPAPLYKYVLHVIQRQSWQSCCCKRHWQYGRWGKESTFCIIGLYARTRPRTCAFAGGVLVPRSSVAYAYSRATARVRCIREDWHKSAEEPARA
jgi:hypothetical protein